MKKPVEITQRFLMFFTSATYCYLYDEQEVPFIYSIIYQKFYYDFLKIL